MQIKNCKEVSPHMDQIVEQKNLQAINPGDGVEKGEHSYTW